MFSLKELCVGHLFDRDIRKVRSQYLDKVLQVVRDNAMEEIFTERAYDYMKVWLETIVKEKFKNDQVFTKETIASVFSLLDVLASNKQIPVKENLINILSEKVFRGSRKWKGEILEEFNIMTEYICSALTKFCSRESSQVNPSSLLYENEGFMLELVDEVRVVTSNQATLQICQC